VRCSAVLARAYEFAAEDNGGDGSVRWEEVDEASREAVNALGVSAMAELIAEAQSVNSGKRRCIVTKTSVGRELRKIELVARDELL
jgi:hypothetical protein